MFWNVGYVFNAENPFQIKSLTRKIRNYEAKACSFENRASFKIVNFIAKHIKLSFVSNKEMAHFLASPDIISKLKFYGRTITLALNCNHGSRNKSPGWKLGLSRKSTSHP